MQNKTVNVNYTLFLLYIDPVLTGLAACRIGTPFLHSVHPASRGKSDAEIQYIIIAQTCFCGRIPDLGFARISEGFIMIWLRISACLLAGIYGQSDQARPLPDDIIFIDRDRTMNAGAFNIKKTDDRRWNPKLIVRRGSKPASANEPRTGWQLQITI